MIFFLACELKSYYYAKNQKPATNAALSINDSTRLWNNIMELKFASL